MRRETFFELYDNVKTTDIINEFHKFYYYSSCIGGTWKNASWLGIPVQKNPMDCWIYQELIYSIKPDIIIETGTKVGGSALFFASICDMVDNGRIITIDIDNDGTYNLPVHDRISYLHGNSVDEKIIAMLYNIIKNKKVMVILDSDHSKNHVLTELKIYSKMVSVDSYLIVEDSNISGFPVHGIEGEGPLEAIFEFLNSDSNTGFKIDRTMEKFYFSFNPYGFLRRIK